MGSNDKDNLIDNIDTIVKDKDQKIILIGTEEYVLDVFKALSKKGYKYMYYFEGGFEGYAAKKGDAFIPEEGCGC